MHCMYYNTNKIGYIYCNSIETHTEKEDILEQLIQLLVSAQSVANENDFKGMFHYKFL